ncbi:amidohydrolase [Sinosporangium siamense]|uniref:Amidohydrolase n=1 Tax=Sinosporangium siamense TaxID=1367973 RepID=A0A919V5S0_9ACTN|nr:amidohydrolase [Sinosporangium siamense]
MAVGGLPGPASAAVSPEAQSTPSGGVNSDITVLRGGTVIDATGARPIRDAVVVTIGDSIVWVGREHRSMPVPAGARVVDVRGKYVIPGLWDMHVHGIYIEEFWPPLFIANGVTGIRETWGLPDVYATRDRIEQGLLTGPRVNTAGPLVDGPGSCWTGYPLALARTPAEGREAVRRTRAEGADWVKVYSFLRRDVFDAIADEARLLGLPFAGHVPTMVSVPHAARSGQRTFEHLYGMAIATSDREEEFLKRLRDTPIDPTNPFPYAQLMGELDREAVRSHNRGKAAALYASLARRGTWQSPTLTVLRVSSVPTDTLVNDPRLKYMPTSLRESWKVMLEARGPRTPERLAAEREFFAFQMRSLGEMRRAGVGVVGGTDVLNPYCMPGFSLHDELRLLVESGLSTLQALQSVTRDAARCLGTERTMGTVTRGKVADLVVLDADPLADIRNTQRIHAVVTRGTLRTRQDLDRILADVEAAAARPGAAAVSSAAARISDRMAQGGGCGCH